MVQQAEKQNAGSEARDFDMWRMILGIGLGMLSVCVGDVCIFASLRLMYDWHQSRKQKDHWLMWAMVLGAWMGGRAVGKIMFL